MSFSTLLLKHRRGILIIFISALNSNGEPDVKVDIASIVTCNYFECRFAGTMPFIVCPRMQVYYGS